MKSALFTFDNEGDRDQFIKAISEAASAMIASSSAHEEYDKRTKNGKLIKNTIRTVKYDPPVKSDHERQCGIWVSGQKLKEGSLAEMNKMFNEEVASHSASVVVRELRDGEWVSVRTRRR